MYASNEDEDWIYLHETPPINTVLKKAVNFLDDDEYSNSSKSDRSISLSSISSNELEHSQSDDVSFSSTNNSINPYDLLSQELISTPTVEDNSQHKPSIHTPTAMNENDILNTGFELSKTSSLRHRTNVNVQQIDTYNSEVNQSTSKRHQYDTLIICICLIISVISGYFLLQINQPTLNTIANELVKTNQQLNKIKDIPLENFQEKLTKQLEDKIQNIINQQLTWHEHEKSLFISQIRGLREVLHKTQQNLTDTIHQLTNKNERLHEQIKLLEERLEVADERYPQNKKTCLEGVNCTKSTLDKLVTNIFKQTISIATDTSVNLSGIFKHLHASISNIVDHRHEKVKKSFHKVKSTYTTWIKSRTQIQQKTRKIFPWRWPFQYGHNRQRIQYQTSSKQPVCYSKFYFPINKICSIKNWMVKFFRS